jgi:hypothetical protein
MSHIRSHHEEISRERYDVPPPEGANLFSMMRWWRVGIESLSSQLDSWDVSFVVKFVKVLEKKCCILGP